MPPQDFDRCPVCSSSVVFIVLEIPDIPVYCNVLCTSREIAVQAPRGEIALACCRDCGHLFNCRFDPANMAYQPGYEASLFFSPRFQNYARSTALRLIERYHLHDADIVEIGCGQGEFLQMLSALGRNRGWGFDPGYRPEANAANDPRVDIRQAFYSRRQEIRPVLICCRHLLEHLQFPGNLVRDVYEDAAAAGAAVFFEVPNALFMLRTMAIWDLIYEHCSYFSPTSLARSFSLAGFTVRELADAFDGQFLYIECHPDASPSVRASGDPVELTGLAATFGERYRDKLQDWQLRFAQMKAAGQRAAIWGCGSKGITFLNVLQSEDVVAYAIDINPRKLGMHVPGTGQPIVRPSHLREEPVSAIVIMNPIYRQEIQTTLDRLGVHPDILVA